MDSDIIYTNLIKYLSNKNLYLLKLNPEKDRIRICKRIFNEINSRLYKLFLDVNPIDIKKCFPKFLKIFKDYHFFISGSFMVQCILQEKWLSSDIDIYIPIGAENQNSPIHHKISKKLFNFFLNDVDAVGRVSWPAEKPIKYHIDNIQEIEEVFFMIKPENKKKDIPDIVKMQFIYVSIDPNVESIEKFIDTNFDFDICKNFYTFDKKYNRYHLKTKDISNIFQKKIKFNYTANKEWSKNRCTKYINRGFTLTNSMD